MPMQIWKIRLQIQKMLQPDLLPNKGLEGSKAKEENKHVSFFCKALTQRGNAEGYEKEFV